MSTPKTYREPDGSEYTEVPDSVSIPLMLLGILGFLVMCLVIYLVSKAVLG